MATKPIRPNLKTIALHDDIYNTLNSMKIIPEEPFNNVIKKVLDENAALKEQLTKIKQNQEGV